MTGTTDQDKFDQDQAEVVLGDFAVALLDLNPVLHALLTLNKVKFIRAIRERVGAACNCAMPDLEACKTVADKVWDRLDIQELRDDQDTLLRNYKEECREHEETQRLLSEERSNMERETTDWAEAHSNLAERTEELRQERDGLKETVEDTYRKLNQANAERHDLKVDNQRLNEELCASEAKVDILMQVIGMLKD